MDASEFSIRAVLPEDTEWIRRLMRERWAAEFVVVHGDVFHPHALPGFVAAAGERKGGLITYHIAGKLCEIVTLDSLIPAHGIGTALLAAVKTDAVRLGCCALHLTTTNDNLHALRFYQKRGFAFAAVRPNAVDSTRKVKPVPLLGENQIPIRDEIDMELLI
ncbi:MAG: GNAT family N-acetyltransferase [Anaerolineales bacterium]